LLDPQRGDDGFCLRHLGRRRFAAPVLNGDPPLPSPVWGAAADRYPSRVTNRPIRDDAPSRTPIDIEALTTDALSRADQRIADGLAMEPPSFETLFGALDDAARIVALAYGQGAFLRSVDTDEAVRTSASAANDQIEKWRSALPQRHGLGAAVAAFVASPAATELDADQSALVRQWQRDIRQSGAGLTPPARAELQDLHDRLVELQGSFMMNLVQETTIELTREELDGVPDGLIASFAVSGTSDLLVVPVNDATAIALLENARRRDVRERMDRAVLSAGMPENRVFLEEAVRLRRRAAALLGYRSWLELRAEGFAAEDGAAIEQFVADVAGQIEPVARAEVQSMRELLTREADAPRDLVVEDWDWRFADARQRAALGGDPGTLREYLEFERVFAGLTALSQDVFGIRLLPRPDRRGWHADVRAFDLVDRDTGIVRARMFFDPFVRPNKQGPAFAEMLDPGSPSGSEAPRPPTMALVTNFPTPGEQPSLLGLEHIDMLFHEFGHVLDFALGAEPFVIHRFDAWTPMDWVEGPSQFLGRWGQHPEVLATFARHHVTGEPIPPALLEALGRLESLNAAVRAMRHLSMGQLDVLLHGEDAVSIDDADRQAWRLRGIPRPEATCFPCSLRHLMGGYDGAIYGFVWSQVLRDDLLARFARDGMTNPSTGAAYRAAILDRPWTRNPLDGLAEFLGRPWSIDAFMVRVRQPPAVQAR
jgi:Zn-dependent oligopeptidase